MVVSYLINGVHTHTAVLIHVCQGICQTVNLRGTSWALTSDRFWIWQSEAFVINWQSQAHSATRLSCFNYCMSWMIEWSFLVLFLTCRAYVGCTVGNLLHPNPIWNLLSANILKQFEIHYQIFKFFLVIFYLFIFHFFNIILYISFL